MAGELLLRNRCGKLEAGHLQVVGGGVWFGVSFRHSPQRFPFQSGWIDRQKIGVVGKCCQFFVVALNPFPQALQHRGRRHVDPAAAVAQHAAHPFRLEAEVASEPFARAQSIHWEDDADMRFVGGFILGETDVAIDAEQGTPLVGNQRQAVLGKQQRHLRNQILAWLAQVVFVLGAVGIEPRFVVVLLQFVKEVEGVGTEAIERDWRR